MRGTDRQNICAPSWVSIAQAIFLLRRGHRRAEQTEVEDAAADQSVGYIRRCTYHGELNTLAISAPVYWSPAAIITTCRAYSREENYLN